MKYTEEGELVTAGKLYLVPTPIGNLKDITLRALEVLKAADLVAAEDTRQTLKLLNHFEIKKPLISYHQHNETVKGEELLQRLRSGETIALVTDAGTPGISDPGSVIVKRCIEEALPFEVLPGATAFTTALIYSGLDTSSFIFKGFIPRENKERTKLVQELKDRRETLIFYEAPHRLKETLSFLHKSFGDRQISICRELTKLHEEILRLSLSEAVKYYESNSPRGEYVLVLSGKSQEEIEGEEKALWEDMTIEEHILSYMDKGMSKKEAVKMVVKDRGVSKSEIYIYAINL